MKGGLVLLSLTFLVSCTNHSNKKKLTHSLSGGLWISNEFIKNNTDQRFQALIFKTKRLPTLPGAQYWLKKATAVRKLTKEFLAFYDTLAQEKVISRKQSDDVHKKINNYQSSIYHVENSLNRFFPSLENSDPDERKRHFYANYFKNANSDDIISICLRLENDLLIRENKMVSFCYESAGSSDEPISDATFIYALNSQSVTPGSQMQLTTGMGGLIIDSTLRVKVFGRQIEMDPNGAFLFSFRAPEKYGTYELPVRIDYTDMNGKPRTFNKTLIYKVIKDCNNTLDNK